MSYHRYNGYEYTRDRERGPLSYPDEGDRRRRYEPYGSSAGRAHPFHHPAGAFDSSSGVRSRSAWSPSRDYRSERGALVQSSSQKNHTVTKSDKDFGFAFIGKEGERRAKQIVRDSEAASLNGSGGSAKLPSSTSTGSLTPLASTSSSSSRMTVAAASSNADVLRSGTATSLATVTQDHTTLTPVMIVDEFKRAGHFDALRKKLLQAFNEKSSTRIDEASPEGRPFKVEFLDSIGDYLLERLGDLPDDIRLNLAKREARLQQSELIRWIDEDARGIRVMGKAVDALRRGDIVSLPQDKSDGPSRDVKDAAEVGTFLREKLSEIVKSERKSRGWSSERVEEPEQNQSKSVIEATKSEMDENGQGKEITVLEVNATESAAKSSPIGTPLA